MKKHEEKKEHIEEEQPAKAERLEEVSVVDEKDEKIEKLQLQIQTLDLTGKRYLADYQNLVRRVEEEKASWIATANKDLLLKLLPVLDTLMLAVKHIDDKGLTISIAQFEDVLKEAGVVRIKTIGEAFDPMTMECITTMQAESKEDIVIEEIRSGYLLSDSVLRSAQVIVGN